jgi:hypothetical protein
LDPDCDSDGDCYGLDQCCKDGRCCDCSESSSSSPYPKFMNPISKMIEW